MKYRLLVLFAFVSLLPMSFAEDWEPVHQEPPWAGIKEASVAELNGQLYLAGGV